jgi:hypothetical protein
MNRHTKMVVGSFLVGTLLAFDFAKPEQVRAQYSNQCAAFESDWEGCGGGEICDEIGEVPVSAAWNTGPE